MISCARATANVAADIAAEDDRRIASAAAHTHLRERRTENMPGIEQRHRDPVAEVERLVVLVRAEQAHRARDILGRIER